MTGRSNRVGKQQQIAYLSVGKFRAIGRRPQRGRIVKDKRIFRFENIAMLTNPK
jgi:hypothetical protein